ncbi:hypothetical protein TBLA_0D05390 [Henningerozyma blattae CBS 6284]|uniref:Uncharacterized protein n=1 Tax=Henningerozyma blattae (strain ATCC 34711 / CBS 6284 / DSM 70876 / NBRC 10599 / NRRL Y-10934 / UCD 77-7) TaxID=1071380 RepID=I2H3T0_HENB6|nr:hypothetical protein TBLA_0D05390 [Tetrapisispora blattae CBS 6284]CCH61032.1 hypothetical protein TBLA_0D05390 [Tetrapisispora blattae CBS 6284]
MTEQISHKKSNEGNPRANTQSSEQQKRERRRQLKEFYKLENPPKKQEADTDSTSSTILESSIEPDTTIPASTTPTIKDHTFQWLLHTHNSLLQKELESNNAIKNTIYENYVDLVKVHELLAIKSARQSHVSELESILNEIME